MEEKKRRLLTRHDPAASAADPAGSTSAPSSATGTGRTDTHSSKPATRVKPLSKLSIGWRIAVPAVALVILTCGQFLNTNDFFPLGSLTQYATAKDLNGTVGSTCIAAQFPGEDEPRRLGFNTATVGIERGDVESQLDRVIAHPELMQSMADSYERLHPNEPKPEKMILCRTTTQLKNGLSVGEPEETTLATWEVR
ncbi:hypothetical protein [Brevibacterium spongiae]|uniref:Uncharacterized protein n=1 Tax=Brevibacterium spongiae TaxID=2909672 RepID=A0ABY5SSE5_9MICO|nr:hypothetical protein [Brevibacterium spongiae]UVI36806.1 hypothetical protein L1F31_03865 [Brevibacterium spongiae]